MGPGIIDRGVRTKASHFFITRVCDVAELTGMSLGHRLRNEDGPKDNSAVADRLIYFRGPNLNWGLANLSFEGES